MRLISMSEVSLGDMNEYKQFKKKELKSLLLYLNLNVN